MLSETVDIGEERLEATNLLFRTLDESETMLIRREYEFHYVPEKDTYTFGNVDVYTTPKEPPLNFSKQRSIGWNDPDALPMRVPDCVFGELARIIGEEEVAKLK